ncbi:MAG: aminoglycoside phosphotransferase family protein [Ilumatobacteraceae bacterium]
MAAQNIPAAEFDVTEDVVRSLLVAQHPDLADRSLALVANGWDNVIFRLGDDLVVRMPRRQLGADLVEHEQRWLPDVAARVQIDIPVPVRHGVPSDEYPWKWSVCPWFVGTVAADAELRDPLAEARRLGNFVAALHTPAPAVAPRNTFRRGQPVRELTQRVDANVEVLGDLIDGDDVRARFHELASVGEWAHAPQWVHGDLHSANVIVSDGKISAVIDFGDITAGDPAVDLAIAWMLFDPVSRAVFRRTAGGAVSIDEATWSRAQAWALHFALVYLLHSADNERFARMGSALLRAAIVPE